MLPKDEPFINSATEALEIYSRTPANHLTFTLGSENPAAPPYEPEKWNTIDTDDYLSLLRKYPEIEDAIKTWKASKNRPDKNSCDSDDIISAIILQNDFNTVSQALALPQDLITTFRDKALPFFNSPVFCTNCWDYATGNIRSDQPGTLGAPGLGPNANRKWDAPINLNEKVTINGTEKTATLRYFEKQVELLQRMTDDGARIWNPEYTGSDPRRRSLIPEGYYAVPLIIQPERNSFHVLTQNAAGPETSHKPGHRQVMHTKDDGRDSYLGGDCAQFDGKHRRHYSAILLIPKDGLVTGVQHPKPYDFS